MIYDFFTKIAVLPYILDYFFILIPQFLKEISGAICGYGL